ncbi:MAG TPA: protein-disulfide reductase DsbD domain-containing protein [Terriglobales bacterium]|nr:protein-disulfide reductase DsbD domain-containing protein [Terriglobales bacterium]
MGGAFRILGLLCLVCLRASAQNSIDAPHVKVSLISENETLQRGKPAWMGVRFQLEKGWHVYWTNPGDSGEPPKVDWKLPPGFEAGELGFPFPHRLPLQSLMNFGYEDEVLYLAKIKVPASTTPGTAELRADVRWMICKDICIPGKGSLRVALPAADQTPKVGSMAAIFQASRERLPKQAGLQVSATYQNDSFIVAGRMPAKQVEFFPFDDLQIDNAAPQTTSATKTGFRLTIKKSEQSTKVPKRIRGVIVVDGRSAYQIDVPVSTRAQ